MELALQSKTKPKHLNIKTVTILVFMELALQCGRVKAKDFKEFLSQSLFLWN